MTQTDGPPPLPREGKAQQIADMATKTPKAPKAPSTARTRFRELIGNTKQSDYTATDIGRLLGISRQRAAALAEEEGVELAKYSRESTTDAVSLAGLDERARRTLSTLRDSIRQAVDLEKRLTRQLAARA